MNHQKHHLHFGDHSYPKSILLLCWLALVTQSIFDNIGQVSFDHSRSDQLASTINNEAQAVSMLDSSIGQNIMSSKPFILFAEAGKKKKEKSEVVVISVNNPKGMGHMYPVYVPSCGHSGGFGRR